MNQEIFLCAINNILSGTCTEDCSFCTQSTKHHAQIERYTYKSIGQIVDEAKRAKRLRYTKKEEFLKYKNYANMLLAIQSAIVIVVATLMRF